MPSLLRILALGCLSTAAGLEAFAEGKTKPKTSPYVSRMIQEGFRKDDGRPPLPDAAGPGIEATAEVVLPTLRIEAGPRIDNKDFMVKEPPKPVLGTGVSEYKGKRVTLKLRRLLFVPLAFKLEW